MGPNKVMEKSGEKKVRIGLTIEMKQEIIEKYEKGMRLIDLAKEYGRNPSTIGTLLKQKESLKAAKPSKGLSVISKKRSAVNDEMERLLLLWIKEKELAGDTVTETTICEKAIAIFNDLEKEDVGEGTSAQGLHPEFKASRGWFEKFKRRTGIYSVVRHCEASNTNQKATEEFVKKFKNVNEEGYFAQQTLNCDEMALFWKKMPRRTFITVDSNDVNESVQEHREEISTNELESRQHTEMQEEFCEHDNEAAIPSTRIKEILGKFHEVCEFVEKNHPEKVFTSQAINQYDEICLSHFRKIFENRQRQTSMDQFYTKRQATATVESGPKPKKAKVGLDM